jgi:hypothetical protein
VSGGAIILVWGGRACSLAFFSAGCWKLYPPEFVAALFAIFLIMVAMIVLITSEGVTAYLVRLDPFVRDPNGKSVSELTSLLRNAYSVFDMAATAITKVRRATVDEPGKNKTAKNHSDNGKSDKRNTKRGRD